MISYQIGITSTSAEQTHRLGRRIGSRLNCALTILLVGELGCGKTVFVQGLARGLDVPDRYYIISPSYTLINEYPGRWRLFHVDLYRLENSSDLEEIGLDEILQKQAVVAVEWADRLPDDAVGGHLTIKLRILDAQTRDMQLIAYGHNAVNLLKTLE